MEFNKMTQEELQEMWVKNQINIHNCLSELEDLNKEKEELLQLSLLENPPEDLLERMKESEQKFQSLLERSKTLKEQAHELKTYIEK